MENVGGKFLIFEMRTSYSLIVEKRRERRNTRPSETDKREIYFPNTKDKSTPTSFRAQYISIKIN